MKIKMKKCSTCKKEKPKTDFYNNKKTKDGLYSACKSCHKAKVSSWIDRNRDKHKIYTTNWAKNNKEKTNTYYWSDLDKSRERYRKLYWSNPDKFRERSRKYYALKKEKSKETSKEEMFRSLLVRAELKLSI